MSPAQFHELTEILRQILKEIKNINRDKNQITNNETGEPNSIIDADSNNTGEDLL